MKFVHPFVSMKLERRLAMLTARERISVAAAVAELGLPIDRYAREQLGLPDSEVLTGVNSQVWVVAAGGQASRDLLEEALTQTPEALALKWSGESGALESTTAAVAYASELVREDSTRAVLDGANQIYSLSEFLVDLRGAELDPSLLVETEPVQYFLTYLDEIVGSVGKTGGGSLRELASERSQGFYLFWPL